MQRNHFGKKRFEILRTGLSKGQATTSHVQTARTSLKARSEISLAHAHRTQGQRGNDTQTWLPNAYDPPSVVVGNTRSPSVTAPHRSRILGVLDAENRTLHLHICDARRKLVPLAIAQRAQVDKILQMPDLLGLTTSPQRSTPPFSCHHDEPICDDSEQHESEDDQVRLNALSPRPLETISDIIANTSNAFGSPLSFHIPPCNTWCTGWFVSALLPTF